MSPSDIRTWQAVRHEVLRRIHARQWKPGDAIPRECDLATEFGCARATVNRALRALAEAGVLDRRRKAGTRVALHPVSRATLDIPMLRLEIEARNQRYGYALLGGETTPAPPAIRARMGLREGAGLRHVRALHLADARPYVLEDRWINTGAVPQAATQDFTRQSANEWLLIHAPYTRGDIAFFAATAERQIADILEIATGAALFVIERTTWDHDVAITAVRLSFPPTYRMHTTI